MFSTLKNLKKNLKEKYQNSSTWGEFFASYLIDLDDIYKRLEGKTETQQIEILKRALEDQTKKTGELIGEVSKQKEQIEELKNSLKKKDLEIKGLESKQKKVNLTNLKELLVEARQGIERIGGATSEVRALIETKLLK